MMEIHLHHDSPPGNSTSSCPTIGSLQVPKEFAVWEIEGHSIVVLPSLSFSARELRTIECILCYEERILFVMFALANPKTHLLILTSIQLDKWVIMYHLSLLPQDRRESATSRVHFYSLGDPSVDRCLAEKLCLDPSGIDRIKQYCVDTKMMTRGTHPTSLMIWRTTEYEDKLGELLGLQFHCATPEHIRFGTKPGSRSLFKHLNIPCADGTYEEERDLDELCKSIWNVLYRNPSATKGVVKLADGFSGVGNAVLDLRLVQERIQTVHRGTNTFQSDKELDRLTKVAFQEATYHHRTWEDYRDELAVMGCIFELYIDIEEKLDSTDLRIVTSPSVQGVIDEHGSVSILSTHEQLLDRQVYLGCEFPCKSDYRLQLWEFGRQIGDFLASVGVRDRFGVDFICVPKPKGSWDIWAVEINLRVTGTTHPWMTLKLLTHGHTDPATGIFIGADGKPKYYVSSDNIPSPMMRNNLYPETLVHLMTARPDLHWNPSQQVGVILHMLTRVSKAGILSMTSVADSMDDARKKFHETRKYLTDVASRCARENNAYEVVDGDSQAMT